MAAATRLPPPAAAAAASAARMRRARSLAASQTVNKLMESLQKCTCRIFMANFACYEARQERAAAAGGRRPVTKLRTPFLDIWHDL